MNETGTHPIYLDNSATTQPTEAVMETVRDAMEKSWHNPSALYKPAMEDQKKVDEVRQLLLKACGAEGERVIFTSCGTEADNLAVLGHLKARRGHGRVLIFSGEHPGIQSCVPEIKNMGYTVEEIVPDRNGVADLGKLENQLQDDVEMIIIMQVNNETGAVQPLAEIAKMRDRLCPKAAIHVDGVQGFMRLPFSMHRLGIQSYALSGHKIHALKGIGALVVSKKHPVRPIQYGGGQEDGYRSGTENTPGILSLGTAIQTYPENGIQHMAELKQMLYTLLKEAIPGMRLNGPEPGTPESSPHILNVSLVPVRSQTMLFALEGDGIYVSAGSACASHKQKVSPVLTGMGLSTQEADCALRFSLCPFITEEDIQKVAERVKVHYELLKPYVRR